MNGINCFFEGLRLVRHPGMRRYVVVPLLINALVLTALLVVGVQQYAALEALISGWLPEWLTFLSWLISLLVAVIIFAVGIYCFSMIANIIASPFNAILSEKIEEHLVPGLVRPEVNLALIMPRAMGRELTKFLYLLPRLAGLLLLSVIPVVNVIAPLAWLLFGAWMMSVQYVDYAADNNQLAFRQLRVRLGKRRIQTLMFGILVYFVVAIPVINLVIMPVAVAGGTVFWVRHLRTSAEQV